MKSVDRLLIKGAYLWSYIVWRSLSCWSISLFLIVVRAAAGIDAIALEGTTKAVRSQQTKKKSYEYEMVKII